MTAAAALLAVSHGKPVEAKHDLSPSPSHRLHRHPFHQCIGPGANLVFRGAWVVIYLAGCIVLVSALGWSGFVLIRTVRPAMNKIRAALRGAPEAEREAA
jgi:hypothetical protein